MIALGTILMTLVKLLLVLYLVARLCVMCMKAKCDSRKRMDGKVVIITGANSGIGKETARDLVHRGARVIFGCRNLAKAAEAAQEILDEKPSGQIIIRYIDNCNLDSVRAFAEEISAGEEKVDVLINNAGIKGDGFRLTVDGFEEIYQVNYLAPFLLTELLLPLLKESSPSRVINVGSSSYNLAGCNPDTLARDFKSNFRLALGRYAATKLLLIMWTRALHDELSGSGVTVNVLHPGIVMTPIGFKKISMYDFVAACLLIFCGRSAKDGAQTLIHLSVENIADPENGQFWSECAPEATLKGNDPDANRRVLAVTRQVLGERPHSD